MVPDSIEDWVKVGFNELVPKRIRFGKLCPSGKWELKLSSIIKELEWGHEYGVIRGYTGGAWINANSAPDIFPFKPKEAPNFSISQTPGDLAFGKALPLP